VLAIRSVSGEEGAIRKVQEWVKADDWSSCRKLSELPRRTSGESGQRDHPHTQPGHYVSLVPVVEHANEALCSHSRRLQQEPKASLDSLLLPSTSSLVVHQSKTLRTRGLGS
jgi:hypothetical protein